MRMLPALFLLSIGCAAHASSAKTAAPSPASATNSKRIALTSTAGAMVMMDYIAIDRARHEVWVPAGNTGNVDVVDTKTGAVTKIGGFATKEVEFRGQKRTVGVSAASIGDGVVYVGSRADAKICAVSQTTRKTGVCTASLSSSPDGVVYVRATKEVWVTTPRQKQLVVLDAATLAQKVTIALDGEPEGYAVDNERGIFYTNLEDADRTLGIDLKTRKVVSTWKPECGSDGPKGLALDYTANILVVACPDHVIALDAAHDGKYLASLFAGTGIDNIDLVESTHELFVASGQSATLTIAKLASGRLTLVATVPTAAGARNAVADESGTAWLIDPKEGAILEVHRE